MYIPFNSIVWWLIILLNFVGFFILRFGIISAGTLKEVQKSVGILLTSTSFILMLIFFGFFQMILLLLILWIFVTPLVMFLINRLEKKLYPYRSEIERKYAEKMGVSIEEVRRLNQMNDDEFMDDMRKQFKWLDRKNENN